MIYLLLIAVVVAGVFIIKHYREQKHLQQRRLRPAERVALEVSLPKDIVNSEERSRGIFHELAQQGGVNKDERKQGRGVASAVFIISRDDPHGDAGVRTYFECDPDYLPEDELEHIIQGAFGREASIYPVGEEYLPHRLAAQWQASQELPEHD